MPDRIRREMRTPSSSTALWPVTMATIMGLPEAGVHLGHFRSTEIALADRALENSTTA